MDINLEKNQIERSITKMKLLGYTLNDGIPTKTHDDWLTALVFPDESFEDVQSRALGLDYASMCFDGKFAKMCYKIITATRANYSEPKSLFLELYFCSCIFVSPPDFAEKILR